MEVANFRCFMLIKLGMRSRAADFSTVCEQWSLEPVFSPPRVRTSCQVLKAKLYALTRGKRKAVMEPLRQRSHLSEIIVDRSIK